MLFQSVREAQRWIGQHPDRVALFVIVLIAVSMRLGLAYRAPVFVRQDSIAYFQSGYELARGIRADIPLRRTPGYPLFLAGAIWTVGEDLNAIAALQHLIGVGTAALTYFLGRAVFGRIAALVAGLLVALSGPLLLYEHYLMSEGVFTFFLTLALWLSVRGLQQSRWRSLVLGGVAVGLGYEFRPVGAALLPVLILGTMLVSGSIRQRSIRAGIIAVGFLVVLGPVLVASRFVSSEGTPALGQTLYGRLVRHDESIAYPDPNSPAPFNDPERAAARKMVLQLAARDARPSAVNHRLQEALGLSPVQADRALRDFAVETIITQPQRFVQGSINKTKLILIGETEKLSFHWDSLTDRALRDDWVSNASIAHVLIPVTESQRRERDATDSLLRVFQPAQYGGLLVILVLLGIAGAVIRTTCRTALLLPLAVLALVIPAGAMVGQVPRYRYPADPLLAVLVGGGVATLIWMTRGAGHIVQFRAAARRPLQPLSDTRISSVTSPSPRRHHR